MFYSALLLTGVNLLLRLVGTSFQVYLSAALGPAGVGLLQLTLSVGNLALVTGMAGVRTASMYLTAEELGRRQPGNISWVLSGCFHYSILFSTGAALALYILAPWLARNWIGDLQALGALRLFAGFLPVSCLCGVMTGYFTGAGRIGTLAAVEVAEQGCTMAATVLALALWAGGDAARACQSVVLGSGCGAVFTLLTLSVLRRRQAALAGPPIPIRPRLLRAALPLALADILRSGIGTAENLLVPKRLGLCARIQDPMAAFGILSGMVFPVVMFPASLLFGLAELLIPELARCAAAGSQRRIRYLVKRSLKATLLYALVFSGLLYLLAVPLCQGLFRNAQAGALLQGYALLVPMLYCDAIIDAMTKGLGQQRSCVRYNILSSALDVVLLYWLLPKYGMGGYFVSFLISHALNFLLSLRRLLTITRQPIPWQIPAISLAAALAAGFGGSQFASPVSRSAVYLALLGSLLCLCQILGQEDIRWLRGLLAGSSRHK